MNNVQNVTIYARYQKLYFKLRKSIKNVRHKVQGGKNNFAIKSREEREETGEEWGGQPLAKVNLF